MTESASVAFRAQLVLPAQRELYDYWIEKAGDRPMPSRGDINPRDFARHLPNVSLIDVPVDGWPLSMRLAGTRIREIYDREVTGLGLNEFLGSEGLDYWTRTYKALCSSCRPAQGLIRGPRLGKDHLVQFWLRLPLRRDDRSVAMILCHDVCIPAVEMPGQLEEAGFSPAALRA